MSKRRRRSVRRNPVSPKTRREAAPKAGPSPLVLVGVAGLVGVGIFALTRGSANAAVIDPATGRPPLPGNATPRRTATRTTPRVPTPPAGGGIVQAAPVTAATVADRVVVQTAQYQLGCMGFGEPGYVAAFTDPEPGGFSYPGGTVHVPPIVDGSWGPETARAMSRAVLAGRGGSVDATAIANVLSLRNASADIKALVATAMNGLNQAFEGSGRACNPQ